MTKKFTPPKDKLAAAFNKHLLQEIAKLPKPQKKEGA
jgi:hypothetical protein